MLPSPPHPTARRGALSYRGWHAPRQEACCRQRGSAQLWPSDNVDDEQVLAAKLLNAGGTWRSYAYNCGQWAPEHTERNQLLISKNGWFDEYDFYVADCKKMDLHIHTRCPESEDEESEHEVLPWLACCEPGTMFMDLDMSVGDEFTPQLVKPGVVFEVHDHGDRRKQSREEVNRLVDAKQKVQLTTQAGDIELCFSTENGYVSLLMRKETAATHRATLQEIAVIKQQRAQERVAEVAAKEAAAKKRRERLELGGPKKKRRRKPDTW